MLKTNKRTHTICLYVQNKPGVLIRISLVFARRGYNIDSLIASPTQNPRFSFITIVAGGDETGIHNILKQLYKLVDVLTVNDITDKNVIQRELVLFKIKMTEQTQREVLQIAQSLHCTVLDVNKTSVILEASGEEKRIERLKKTFRLFPVVEFMRTGKVVMNYEENEKNEE